MDRGAPPARGEQDSPIAGASDARERRSAGRLRTVCRIVRVERQTDVGLWRVRNLSDSGAMLAADVAITVGEAIVIAFSEKLKVRGVVKWRRDGQCGVAFDTPVDAAALLKALGEEQRAEGYRALRLAVTCKAEILLKQNKRPIDLVDLSQQGAGFVYAGQLNPGDEFDLLLLDGVIRRRAIVRWAKGRRGGLWFTAPIGRSDLESIRWLMSPPG